MTLMLKFLLYEKAASLLFWLADVMSKAEWEYPSRGYGAELRSQLAFRDAMKARTTPWIK
jgi:hypothetical protein